MVSVNAFTAKPWVRNSLTVLAFLLILSYIVAKALEGGDFIGYLAAADALYHYHNCYNTLFTYAGRPVFVQYSYSPAFAIMLIPFSQLPPIFSTILFLCTFPLMIFRIHQITCKRLGLNMLSPHVITIWALLLYASTLRYFLHNFEMVQANLLLLYLSMEGLYQIDEKRNNLSGAVLIALGAIIKILPAIFIPYLFLKKHYKAGIFCSLILAALIFAPLPFWGWSFTSTLLTDWWGIINPWRPEYTTQASVYGGAGIQNLSAFISAVFSSGTFRHFLPALAFFTPETVKLIITVLQLSLMLFTLYFTTKTVMRPYGNVVDFAAEAYVFLITPLVFPHQQKYAFVFIYPAYAFIYYCFLTQQKTARPFYYALALASFLLLTLTSDAFIGQHLSTLLQHYRIITVGAFILILLLVLTFRDLVSELARPA